MTKAKKISLDIRPIKGLDSSSIDICEKRKLGKWITVWVDDSRDIKVEARKPASVIHLTVSEYPSVNRVVIQYNPKVIEYRIEKQQVTP